MALPLFAITLFVSAFLLFLVQPMIGKMILPKLGGTPQVWNTCMVFFQSILLLGYFYTHATTTYLKARKQMIVHGILLFIPLIILLVGMKPFDVEDWDPPAGTNPIFETLKLLFIVVGVPFFVVSTSAPLLQKWFSFSGDKTANDPYFLYGASNLGSLLCLIAYPFLVEPAFYVTQQAWIWTIGYAILVVMILASAALVWKNTENLGLQTAPSTDPAPAPLPEQAPVADSSTAIQSGRMIGKKKGLKPGATTEIDAPSIGRPRIQAITPQNTPVTWARRFRWVMLAAVPSSLMLGVTSFVSTDLSPFPLLWVIPLALYLLSFILVFSKWPLAWTKEPHTLIMYILPLAIIFLCLVMFPPQDYSPTGATIIAFFCFFLITMGLHGELAKDRPSPQHLTEFFLLMSFGGMLGGMFNALLAPVIFTGVAEYPLALFFGCFLRPNMAENGWSDGLVLQNPGVRESAREASDNFSRSFGQEPTGNPFLMAYVFDILIAILIGILAYLCLSVQDSLYRGFIGFLEFIGLPTWVYLSPYGSPKRFVSLLAIYGLPILCTLLVLPRTLRFALGVGSMLFLSLYIFGRGGDHQLYADRSYFGVLKVMKDSERAWGVTKGGQELPMYVEVENLPEMKSVPFNYLMHGSTYHGRNYQVDQLARLATTYYHRYGPVGAIMEKYNWFPGKQNTYNGDLRLPVSMIGLGASPMGISSLPVEQLANVWSEPPFATVGLGTGSMASYCRWLQHLTYYEIDEKIRKMSLPPDGRDPYFRYVKDATDRGGFVEIVMGDARQSLKNEAKREAVRLQNKESGPTAMREGYYKVIVLDAFSSDAIPVHLITKEAVELYLQKLAPDGVLCVHTSNRHLQLIDPVADIATKLGLEAFLGKDEGGSERSGRERDNKRVYSMGHFGSEYIMLARKGVLKKDLLDRAIAKEGNLKTSVVHWSLYKGPNRTIWSDHYQDIVSIMR